MPYLRPINKWFDSFWQRIKKYFSAKLCEVKLFSTFAGQPNVSWPDSEIYERPHVLVTSPGSPERQDAPVLGQGPTSVGGRIQVTNSLASPGRTIRFNGVWSQVRLGFDTATLQLFVTIVCATGLRPRSEQQARNPYCKLFLLPDRSEKSKRRTRTLGGNFW